MRRRIIIRSIRTLRINIKDRPNPKCAAPTQRLDRIIRQSSRNTRILIFGTGHRAAQIHDPAVQYLLYRGRAGELIVRIDDESLSWRHSMLGSFDPRSARLE